MIVFISPSGKTFLDGQLAETMAIHDQQTIKALSQAVEKVVPTIWLVLPFKMEPWWFSIRSMTRLVTMYAVALIWAEEIHHRELLLSLLKRNSMENAESLGNFCKSIVNFLHSWRWSDAVVHQLQRPVILFEALVHFGQKNHPETRT